jgi:hypothetical protein
MSVGSSRKNKNLSSPNGETLITDFQTAQFLLYAIDSAELQAKKSETETLNKFSSYKKLNDHYVRPQDLPIEDDVSLTQLSLNSHLQKVQSDQIKESGSKEIRDLQLAANGSYLNKKVVVRAIDRTVKPFHNCWLDKRSGQLSYGQNNKQLISGRITEVNLSGNYVLIKPKTRHQLISKSLNSYLAEIIDPSTGQSLVSAVIE